MRVLFASGIDGFCHRYAVLHWAEQIGTQGIASTVRADRDPRLAADLASHDVLVLYRVPFSRWIAHLLVCARELGCAIVFAVDDLIFDPARSEAPPLRRMEARERHLWHEGVARYRRTLDACDAFLTTSASLAVAGRATGKPTYLHRAGLAARELTLAAAARAVGGRRAGVGATGGRPGGANTTEDGTTIRLGYWSGTPTHNDDLATIVPVLADFLSTTPDVELVLGGHLGDVPALARFGSRVSHFPFVPWPELPALVASTDVNLAPLEWQEPFVAAKGAIKYLEAAAVGVPTIASPTEAFRDAIVSGSTGWLATDTHEWRRALALLTGDAALRRRLGAAARADVIARFGPATQGPALAAILGEIHARHREGCSPASRAAREVRSDARVQAPAGLVDELALARAFAGEVSRAAREPYARPDVTSGDASTTTPPLADGVLLAQRFSPRYDKLTRIDIQTVTYGLALDHTLEFRLRRDNGSIVTRASVHAALAPDRDWLALEFDPEAASAGCRYVLEITARGTGSRNALSFATTAAPELDGPFAIAGREGSGSLAIRTFAAEETVGGDGIVAANA